MIRQPTYTAPDWPHGLRCSECKQHFIEGQPIHERVTAIYTPDPDLVAAVQARGFDVDPDEPETWTNPICALCDLVGGV